MYYLCAEYTAPAVRPYVYRPQLSTPIDNRDTDVTASVFALLFLVTMLRRDLFCIKKHALKKNQMGAIKYNCIT